MSNKANRFDGLRADVSDAGWRLAGSQLVKLTREPLAALLCRHLPEDDPALRARLAAFLETEIGEALLSSLLSIGLSMLPDQTGDVSKRLSRELRIRAMTEAGDLLADLLMGPLRQVASMYLRGAPDDTEEIPPALEGKSQERLEDVEVPQSISTGVGVKSR